MTAFELWNGKIFLDYLAAVDRGHNCCTSLYTNITVEYFQNLGRSGRFFFYISLFSQINDKMIVDGMLGIRTWGCKSQRMKGTD